jgi:hypothetical protein
VSDFGQFARIGTNAGHGHAWPRPDGVKARCGGVVICRECAADNSMVDRWRKAASASTAAEHGPIDPQLHELMNSLAHVLDVTFNGEDCPADKKQVGFFLTTFNMNDPDPGRFNYISNADKRDVRAMLREILARIEGRLAEAPGAVQ